jgi:hypothetical protein
MVARMSSGKFCKDCGEVRPVEEFWRDKRRPDGLAFYCKTHARRRWFASKDRRVGPPKYRFPREAVIPEGHKWCPDCDTVKPVSDFPKTRASTSGYHTYCKPCHNARGKASKDKVGGSRTYHLKRRYGISAEDADAMLEAQGGLCAICGAAPAGHVDHDHQTGAVRALLCFNCNGGLGQFRDDPAILRAAAEYIEEHRRRQQRPRPLHRPRRQVVARVERRGRPGVPPVGSGRRPVFRTGLCERGRRRLAEYLAEREADT